MSDSKYSNLGSEISDMVQNAIDSQDFSQLSTTIQNSVSQIANTVADTVYTSVVDEPQLDRRPDYMKNAQHKMEAAQNPWMGSSKAVQETDIHCSGRTGALFTWRKWTPEGIFSVYFRACRNSGMRSRSSDSCDCQ